MKVQETKTERGIRAVLPFLSTLALILLMQPQYKIAYFNNMVPFLSLAAVYYWCIFKPRLMPVSVVFLLGLIQDILSGGPLGMMALLLILVRVFVLSQGRRLLEREFLFNWLVFFVLALVFGFVTWAVASLYLREAQNYWTILGQSMLTIAIFPAVVWILGRVRRLLVAEIR